MWPLKLEDLPQNTKMFGKPIHGCHRDAYQHTSVFYPTNISHHYLGSVLGLFHRFVVAYWSLANCFFHVLSPNPTDYHHYWLCLGCISRRASFLRGRLGFCLQDKKKSGGRPGRKTYPGNKDFVTSAYPIPSIPSIGELVHHFPYKHHHFPGSPCPVAPWVWVSSLAQLPPRRRGTSGSRSNVMG